MALTYSQITDLFTHNGWVLRSSGKFYDEYQKSKLFIIAADRYTQYNKNSLRIYLYNHPLVLLEAKYSNLEYNHQIKAFGPFTIDAKWTASKYWINDISAQVLDQDHGDLVKDVWFSLTSEKMGELSLMLQDGIIRPNQNLMRAGKENLKKITSKDLRESRSGELFKRFMKNGQI